MDIYTVITTVVPLDKCKDFIYAPETLKLMPKIISFVEFDGEERMERARDLLRHDADWSDIEGYDLVCIPKMFTKDNDIILEEVCDIFSKMKMENRYMKYHLGRCLQCMIHKYAKTWNDVVRLEGVIKMCNLNMDADTYIEQIEEKGIKKGYGKGELNMARRFAEEFGIDKATAISGFSKDQILNGL